MIDPKQMFDQEKVYGYPVYQRMDMNQTLSAGPFRVSKVMMMRGDIIASCSDWERAIEHSFHQCCEPMLRRMIAKPN